MTEHSESTFGTFVDEPRTSDLLADRWDRYAVSAALTQEERLVLEGNLFGDGTVGRSLAAIARDMNMSRQQVWRIKYRALAKVHLSEEFVRNSGSSPQSEIDI